MEELRRLFLFIIVVVIMLFMAINEKGLLHRITTLESKVEVLIPIETP